MAGTTKSPSTNGGRASARSHDVGKGAKDCTAREATGMFIYTRVSTTKQVTDNQSLELMSKFPGAVLIEETASGTKERPKLEAMIKGLRKGDTVIVYSVDRLGRSTRDVLGIIERLMALEVELILIREGLNYSSAAGRFLIQVIAAGAEMERNLVSERTKVALAARKAKGVRLGRPKTLSEAKRKKALQLLAEGRSYRDVAKELGVGLATLQRWAKA